MQVPVYVMNAIAQCTKLESLNLLHQRSVTLEGLQTLSSLTGLQELALGPCPAACDGGAALLAQHSMLTKLIDHCLWMLLQRCSCMLPGCQLFSLWRSQAGMTPTCLWTGRSCASSAP